MLKGERVILRPIEKEDAARLWELLQTVEVKTRAEDRPPVPRSRSEEEAELERDPGPGAGESAEPLYAPGSILRVLVDTTNAISYGMPDTAAVDFTNSVTFDVGAASQVRVIARYPDRGEDILLSGYLQGASQIAGKAAAISAPVGRGHVVMFGFRPQHRGQSYGTFRMLFNALTFGPLAVMAWLTLDRYSISRFSIGYAPMFAIFAADGIARISRRPQVESALGGALVAAFLFWTLPALTPVRNDVAPSVLGVQAVQQHLDLARQDLFVAFSMSPFIDYLAPHLPYKRVYDERAMPLSATDRPTFLLTELEHTPGGGYVFRRPRGHL